MAVCSRRRKQLEQVGPRWRRGDHNRHQTDPETLAENAEFGGRETRESRVIGLSRAVRGLPGESVQVARTSPETGRRQRVSAADERSFHVVKLCTHG